MLTIELVPSTAWNKNLRSELSKERWDELRKKTYKDANYLCEVCGGKGPKHPVECHEIWRYDDVNKIQKLIGLIALCPSCHMVKHIGKANIDGKLEEAKSHLAYVNHWDDAKASLYIKSQFSIWRERSKHDWKLDLSWLEK